MSLRKNENDAEYKMPESILHSVPFTRKPEWLKCTWQVFWLALQFDTFPSLILIRQWYVDRTGPSTGSG